MIPDLEFELSLKHGNRTVTVTLPEDAAVDELRDVFRSVLILVGFTQKTVDLWWPQEQDYG